MLARATYTATPPRRSVLYGFVAAPLSVTLEREGNHPCSPEAQAGAAAQTHAATAEGAKLQGSCQWAKRRRERLLFSFLFAWGFI